MRFLSLLSDSVLWLREVSDRRAGRTSEWGRGWRPGRRGAAGVSKALPEWSAEEQVEESEGGGGEGGSGTAAMTPAPGDDAGRIDGLGRRERATMRWGQPESTALPRSARIDCADAPRRGWPVGAPRLLRPNRRRRSPLAHLSSAVRPSAVANNGFAQAHRRQLQEATCQLAAQSSPPSTDVRSIDCRTN